MLVASSRTSRFADNDIGINLQTVNISVGDKNLLVDAHLQLKTGVHYSLLGRNGVGKSILMHCLVTGLLLSPELRSSLRIMLIRQTLEDSEVDLEPGAEPKTVMEELETRPFGADFIMSEKERWALKAQQQSGARGKYAREMLVQFESLCESAEASSTSDFDDYYDDPTPAMIMSTAKSLKITEAMLKRPLRELSGGWKMRVQLAKALLYKPDLLLLDEPTNHLDIAGISWLEKTIKEQFEGVTLLIVSHNRSFLNAVTEETILFKNQKLEYFKGNYDTYLQAVEEKTLFNERMQESLDKKKAHMKQSIEKSSKIAHKHGDDKRMRQVATKKFKLEERVGYERNEKGHRFKLNRDRPGFHNTTRGDVDHIEDENKQTVLRFNIPSPEQLRTHGPLLSVEDISFERRHPKTKERIFALEHITFNVSAGQRVAILGANGQGKSTLLNLLAAAWNPIRGSIQRKSSQIGYFRQEVVTELGKVTASPLERLVELEPQQPQKELWKHLGSFGLGAQTIATKTEINQMSGGQRVAFAFAELTCTSPPPSLLLLDEPNSHLDLDALEALETSLNEYEGGIVFVSHDISFIKNVATDAYWISNGKMRKIELDEIDSLAMGSNSVAGARKK